MSESHKEDSLWEYPLTQEKPVRRLTQAYDYYLSQLPIFHSLPPTTKIKPRVFHINEETSTTPSLEDIVLDSFQSIEA